MRLDHKFSALRIGLILQVLSEDRVQRGTALRHIGDGRRVFLDPGLADVILQRNELQFGCEGRRGSERKQRSGESRHYGWSFNGRRECEPPRTLPGSGKSRTRHHHALTFRVSEKAARPIRGKEPVEQAVFGGLLQPLQWRRITSGGWLASLAINGDVPPNLPLAAAAGEASATIVATNQKAAGHRGRTLIEHPGNRSRQVRLACGAEVAESSQFGRDCAQTAPLTRFGAPTRQLSGGTDLRPSQWPCSALTRSHVWRKISRAFSYSANAPAICRIILRDGSLRSVRSSPLAVSTRTPRCTSAIIPSSWVISSRAKRKASSTMTTRTPFPSIRSSSLAKPGRSAMGSAPDTPGSENSSTRAKPARLAKTSIASRCRHSLSFSGPTFAAELVRR